ncbi:MAG: ABC transporter substrate-binding protein, partial [Clostridia bacterium]
SATLYATPIKGVNEFRNQNKNFNEAKAEFDAIYAAGPGATSVPGVTGDVAAKGKTYWDTLEKGGPEFAKAIVDTVVGGYGGNAEHTGMIGATPEQVKADAKLQLALGMALWGYGNTYFSYSEKAEGGVGFVENAKGSYHLINGAFDCFTTVEESAADYKRVALSKNTSGKLVYTEGEKEVEYTGKEYEKVLDKARFIGGATGTLYQTSELTTQTYWNELKAGYTGENGVVDYQKLISTEGAGSFSPITSAEEKFISTYFATSEAVPTVSGITKGKTTVGGVEYETVEVVTTHLDPTAISQLGVIVCSKDYYTNGFKYTAGSVNNYGVQFGKKNADGSTDVSFMQHLKKFNGAPMGSNAYKMGAGPKGGFYEDNVIYYERNEEFKCYNLGVAKIKYLRHKVLTLGSELDALKTKEIHFATVDATSANLETIASNKFLTDILVDNLGYGYICINANVYPNISTRLAIASTFDIGLIKNYYPNGLAEEITRSMSKTLGWVYTEDYSKSAKRETPYDKTGEKAKEYLLAAGYKQVGGKWTDSKGADFKIELSIPSAADSHPAGAIFIESQRIFKSIGVACELKVDESLIANIKSGEVGVYTLAWQATLDPDLTQVYSYKSAADSVVASGLKQLHELGKQDQGIITWKGKELTQSVALEELNTLIENGKKTVKQSDRAPIYQEALDLIAKLSIEIPTYQRKNMFVYNSEMVDASTLPTTINAYWAPLAEIWKVSYVK